MDMLIRLHDVKEDDADAVERWLDEILPTHEAIGEYTFSVPDEITVAVEPVPAMYAVAHDGEVATLDELRRRAGLTWECYGGGPDELKSCWTNTASVSYCENCGRRRPDSKSAAS